jgi:hypothetical protein
MCRVSCRAAVVIAVIAVSAVGASGVAAQEPTPGSYYGYTTGNAVGPVATTTDRLQVTPAFFGKLIVDARGAYRFNSRAGGGRVTLDAGWQRLSFTGDMQTMRGESYSSSEHRFTLTNGSFAFICTLDGAVTTSSSPPAQRPQTAPTPDGRDSRASTRNEGTTGTLLVTESHRLNNFLGSVR